MNREELEDYDEMNIEQANMEFDAFEGRTAKPVSQIEIPDTRDISECCVRCAVDADLRGLADEWVRDAGGNVSAEADEVRAVLDKHAGEQPRPQTDPDEAKALQLECDRQWLDSLGPDLRQMGAARRAFDKHASEHSARKIGKCECGPKKFCYRHGTFDGKPWIDGKEVSSDE